MAPIPIIFHGLLIAMAPNPKTCFGLVRRVAPNPIMLGVYLIGTPSKQVGAKPPHLLWRVFRRGVTASTPQHKRFSDFVIRDASAQYLVTFLLKIADGPVPAWIRGDSIYLLF